MHPRRTLSGLAQNVVIGVPGRGLDVALPDVHAAIVRGRAGLDVELVVLQECTCHAPVKGLHSGLLDAAVAHNRLSVTHAVAGAAQDACPSVETVLVDADAGEPLDAVTAPEGR